MTMFIISNYIEYDEKLNIVKKALYIRENEWTWSILIFCSASITKIFIIITFNSVIYDYVYNLWMQRVWWENDGYNFSFI